MEEIKVMVRLFKNNCTSAGTDTLPAIQKKMNRYKILLCLLILSFPAFSQEKDELELPQIEASLRSFYFPFHSIFINKDNEIFFGDDKIEVYEVKERLYGPYYKHRNYDQITMNPTEVHLFADVNADYAIIDAVKTEIASTNTLKKVLYRSNFEMEKSSEMFGIKYKLPPSYYRFIPPEKILNSEEKRERIKAEKENRLLGMPDVPEPQSPFWDITSAEKIIYTIQPLVIKEFFPEKKAAFLNVGKDYFEFNSEKILFSEIEKLKTLLTNYDVVIINFQKGLKYSTYIKYLKTIIPVEDSLYPIEIVEYSNDIKLIHQKAGIDLKEIIQ